MTEVEITELIRQARQIFLEQPTLLELEPPLKVGSEKMLLLLLSFSSFCFIKQADKQASKQASRSNPPCLNSSPR